MIINIKASFEQCNGEQMWWIARIHIVGHLGPPLLHCNHRGPIPILPTQQAHSRLRSLTIAFPSVSNSCFLLSPDIYMAHFLSYFRSCKCHLREIFPDRPVYNCNLNLLLPVHLSYLIFSVAAIIWQAVYFTLFIVCFPFPRMLAL